MQLIDNWQQAHRFASVIVAAVIVFVGGLYAALPQFKELLPPEAFALLSAVLGVLVIVARVVKQTLDALPADQERQP